MREGGAILAAIVKAIAATVKPGIKTQELEDHARTLIAEKNAEPAFLGYRGFPAALCVSINEEIVHGIPSARILKEGDILKLDLGIRYKNMYTDHAITMIVGSTLDSKKQKLIDVAKEALAIGIEAAQVGNTTGDIGSAIYGYVREQDLEVVRELIGHGVGRGVHEEPEVPNYGAPGTGAPLKPGMTIAIEPMVVAGTHAIMEGSDGFSYITKDKKPAAHFEHTVLIAEDGPVILTQ
ncbi:MAG TPA: type I methionyl aminopeptidase [Candidatus Paceibacterota bacterium]|nr:type I methionyl aminopeptidase [Candidatus Paceibacterota bacterium]